MKINDILHTMKASQPKLFADISDVQATQFAAALLDTVGRVIDNTQEGPVAVARLGRFNVKQVSTPDNPGMKTRRVIFARPKAVGEVKAK